MKRVSAVLLAVLMTVTLFSCGTAGDSDVVEFVINNGAEPETLDPHLISGVPEHRIYMSLFEGLTSYDPKTALAVPGLAESWDVSEDGTVYTFHLRDAVWSDGVAITADTFVQSWLRELAPETASPYAWFPAMFIEGADAYNSGEAGSESVKIAALDDKTFEVTLVGPLPYVLDALPHYSFAAVPIHAIEEYGSAWTLPENFVGNGPFVLETWKPQEKLTVVPNEQYWDREAVKLDRVVYLPIDDNNTAHNMYLNEEADWNVLVPLDQLNDAKLRDDYHNSPSLSTYYYIFETTTAPFDDVRVRKALTLAFDRQALVEKVTKGGQVPAFGIVPSMAGYDALPGKMDIAEAKRLLAEAGYPEGSGWPEVTLLYNTNEAHKKVAEFIQQQWEENLGITIGLENQEWKTFLSTRREHQFSICRAGWVGDYPDPNTFLDMFVTGGALNEGQYSSDAYDTAIYEAARMNAGVERMEKLRVAEENLINKDQAIMPIYYYADNNLVDTDEWGGWYTNIMNIHPTKNVYRK